MLVLVPAFLGHGGGGGDHWDSCSAMSDSRGAVAARAAAPDKAGSVAIATVVDPTVGALLPAAPMSTAAAASVSAAAACSAAAGAGAACTSSGANMPIHVRKYKILLNRCLRCYS